MDLVTVFAAGLGSVIADGQRQEMKLDIGVCHILIAPDKTAGFKMVCGSYPGSVKEPLITDKRFFPPFEGRVHGYGFFAFILNIDFQVVLQVLSNTREIVDNRDAESFELPGIPDTGQLE